MRYTKGASCDAFYYNLLLHIEGIALQGSFLLPFKSVCPFLLRCPKEMDVIRALIHPWALGLAYILVRLEKGTAALRGSCRANSSHRLCRMLRSPELYQPLA